MARARHCVVCDKELRREYPLATCASCIAELEAPVYDREPTKKQVKIPAPAVGLHVAGPAGEHVQRCVRCGDVLAWCGSTAFVDQESRVVPYTKYPEGAHVERFPLGAQAMYLGHREPNCRAEAPRATA